MALIELQGRVFVISTDEETFPTFEAGEKFKDDVFDILEREDTHIEIEGPFINGAIAVTVKYDERTDEELIGLLHKAVAQAQGEKGMDFCLTPDEALRGSPYSRVQVEDLIEELNEIINAQDEENAINGIEQIGRVSALFPDRRSFIEAVIDEPFAAVIGKVDDFNQDRGINLSNWMDNGIFDPIW